MGLGADLKNANFNIDAEKTRKRNKKIAIIVTPIVCVIVISFLIVLSAVIIPTSKYNAAVALYNSKKYTEAISAFEALNGYKDSKTQIEKCETAIKDEKYAAAVALYNGKKYTEAISAFEALNGYKDSKTQIEKCETAIKDEKYAAAVALYNGKKYTEAISAFEALNGYKDSETQIEKCETAIKDEKYDAAVALYNSKKYTEAISAFEALNGYKDSKTQIEKCETAIKDEKYAAAVALYNSKKYTEAISAFEALDGYKDSKTQIEKCETAIKNEKYAAVKVGSTIMFGSYEQDNNTSNGKEEIEWIVLAKEGTKILVISKYALDCQQYNSSYTDVTWETCSLRTWLNGTFYNAAFGTKQKAMIQKTTVSADKNPEYSTNPGNATSDNVFLLSITEVNKYFSSNEERRCVPTAYAIAKGVEPNSNYTVGGKGVCLWWLRSPGFFTNRAALVDIDGSVYHLFDVINVRTAVRPALWIDLSK